MTPAQLALARQNAYKLLGQLLLQGVTATLLPQVMAVAEWAQRQPAPFDPDAAAADHQHLFGFNLFPYESLFRHPSGLLGGAVTQAVAQTYGQHAFSPPTADAAPDHMGVELTFLAFLCGAEVNIWRGGGLPAAVSQAQAAQRHFLQTHLLPWLPPLAVALRQQPLLFYQSLADLLLELAAEHAVALGMVDTPEIVAAPSPPSLLEDGKTSLRDIARFLMTPPYSGLWLSREDVGRLARQRQLPHGFGERQQMLLNTLRAAAQYDALAPFLADLHAYWGQWQAAYQALAAQFPIFSPFVLPWRQRCQDAGILITEIAARAPLDKA